MTPTQVRLTTIALLLATIWLAPLAAPYLPKDLVLQFAATVILTLVALAVIPIAFADSISAWLTAKLARTTTARLQHLLINLERLETKVQLHEYRLNCYGEQLSKHDERLEQRLDSD